MNSLKFTGEMSVFAGSGGGAAVPLRCRVHGPDDAAVIESAARFDGVSSRGQNPLPTG